MQIVHFHQSNSGRTVYAAQNRGVVTWWQLCNDRRLSAVRWGVTAGPDVAHLVAADNPADDRVLPVIIGANQGPCVVVQLQGRISQGIRNVKRRCR